MIARLAFVRQGGDEDGWHLTMHVADLLNGIWTSSVC